MLNSSKSKVILSKIKVGQLNYKKIIKIKISTSELQILNTLWKKSFIYGFHKRDNVCIIFLKYNSRGLGVLSLVHFVNINLTKKNLRNLLSLNPHQSYFVLTKQGLSVYSANYLKINCGGRVIAIL